MAQLPLGPKARLGLLVLANFLASLGGGRVISAGKGVTGLTLLGSGTILAFIVGNALSLVLLMRIRRFPPGRALLGTSIAATACSAGLAVLLFSHVAGIPLGAPVPLLTGISAWLFFAIFILRCSFWYAGRSLRTNIAAYLDPSWLGFVESSYFFGFIVGLLLGPAIRSLHITQSLLLDFTVLVLVGLCDLWQIERGASLAQSRQTGAAQNMTLTPEFWRLSFAFASFTVGVQIVVFHVADALAQLAFPVRADFIMAAFYLGVSSAAAMCALSKPVLRAVSGSIEMVFRPSTPRPVRAGLVPLVALVSGFTALSVIGLSDTAKNAQVLWPVLGAVSLLLLTIGSWLFEFLVLAIVGRINEEVRGGVALSLGLAATAAAIGMFVMLMTGTRLLGWLGTIFICSGAVPLLVRAAVAKDGSRPSSG